MSTSLLTFCLAGFLLTQNPSGADPDIPSHEVDDAIMAGADEVRDMRTWFDVTWLGRGPDASTDVIRVELRRQDHSELHFGQSCMGTDLRIGQRSFQHGLGTHANSEIVVTVPQNAKQFRSFVGVDNNFDTGGTRGSVEFIVELAGREVERTGRMVGSDPAREIVLDLPADAKSITLKTDTTADGPGWDQCDWADARFILGDGTIRWVDEARNDATLLGSQLPFSFVYGGEPSGGFISKWPCKVESSEKDNCVEHRIHWDEPAGKLRVTAVARVFHRYPAVDWVLHFENRGNEDTSIIENIQALDLTTGASNARYPVLLHQLNGDTCDERAFLPTVSAITSAQPLRIAPTGGRPSSISAFPFFNLQKADRGVIVGIGWTGQWAAAFERDQAGRTRVQAGMEKTHLLLKPGEKIRSPRILLMSWNGDRQTAHNRFRRLMQFHYVPRINGQPVPLPMALQTFDRYVSRAGWATEAGQIAAAQAAKAMGFDALWFDAGWFPGGFPNGVGNWFPNPKAFPKGLKPLGDECHRLGMRFILWFEPERVAAGTQIANEHPDFVFGGKQGGLFKLNDPQARRWLTDLLCRHIEETGMDVYRNDFNIDPLDFWRRNDTPDRQGMTEIRYVEGLYTMWDEMLARFPGLYIDNCASGGRRIDLEACMRSVPLWRSDTGCSPGHPDWNQQQYHGLGHYVPLNTIGTWATDAYTCRSGATGGVPLEWPYLDEGFSLEKAQVAMAEIRENRKFYYGDFYPLTPMTAGADSFPVYQLHRPDLDAGLVLAFRREHCRIVGLVVAPAAVKPDASYQVEFIDENREKRVANMTGKEMTAGLELRVKAPAQSMAVRYTAIKPGG